MKALRVFGLFAVVMAAGCGDHRMAFVSAVWPIESNLVQALDLGQEDLGSFSHTSVDTRKQFCVEPAAGGGAPLCYDEPFYDTVAAIRFVNEFPADPSDPAAGGLTLTSFVLEIVSDEDGAPALPMVTSTIRQTIPAASQRNIIFPLATLEAKRAFSLATNAPHVYIAGYRFKVEGRDPLTASTPIEMTFLSGCPDKTILAVACP